MFMGGESYQIGRIDEHMSQPDGLMKQDVQLVHYLLGFCPKTRRTVWTKTVSWTTKWPPDCAASKTTSSTRTVMGTLDQITRQRFRSVLPQIAAPPHESEVRPPLSDPRRSRRAGAECAHRGRRCSRSNRVRRFPLHLWISKPGSSVHQSRLRWPLVTAAASFLIGVRLLVNDVRFREGLNQARREGTVQDRAQRSGDTAARRSGNENAHTAEALEELAEWDLPNRCLQTRRARRRGARPAESARRSSSRKLARSDNRRRSGYRRVPAASASNCASNRTISRGIRPSSSSPPATTSCGAASRSTVDPMPAATCRSPFLPASWRRSTTCSSSLASIATAMKQR